LFIGGQARDERLHIQRLKPPATIAAGTLAHRGI
jgi:hypothetical protein